MFEGHRVLITGGAGFIGSHLTGRIIEANQVTIFDLFRRDSLSTSGLVGHPHLSVTEGDILDGPAVRAAAAGHDVIVHCAAVAGIDTVGRKPVETLKINVLGSVNVLEAAREQSHLSRVVCLSTSEVFGRHSAYTAESSDARIGPPGEARWTYAAGKLAEEHFALAYHHEYGVPAVVVRPFNVYGPRQMGEGAIQIFVRRAISGQPLEIRGDGSAVRAWTYIDDMVEGLLAILTTEEAVGTDFNIGNPDTAVSVIELAKEVLRVSASDSPIVHLPPLTAEVETRIPEIAKARRVLGFDPRIGLEEGLARTIDWYRSDL